MELHGRRVPEPHLEFQRFLTEACYWAGVWQDPSRDSCQQPLSSSSLNGQQWHPGCGPAPLPAGFRKGIGKLPPRTVALLMKSAGRILDDAPRQCYGLSGFISIRRGLSLRTN